MKYSLDTPAVSTLTRETGVAGTKSIRDALIHTFSFWDQKTAATRDPPLHCYMHFKWGLPILSHRSRSSASMPNNVLRCGMPTPVSRRRSRNVGIIMLCKFSATPPFAHHMKRWVNQTWP
jgi:hypothetical protein